MDVSFLDFFNLAVWGGLFLLIIVKFFQSIRLVPTKSAYIVERLGKYNRTLGAGFHALIPFIDKVPFQVDLKEETIEVPPQTCFSKILQPRLILKTIGGRSFVTASTRYQSQPD